jgi:hypothetical protein
MPPGIVEQGVGVSGVAGPVVDHHRTIVCDGLFDGWRTGD